jgi:hypothetical protein
MRKSLYCLVYILLFSPLLFGVTVSCQPDHESVFTRKNLLTANDRQLPTTEISPHLRCPIRPGRNVLWCGSFQLAWNKLAELLGEDPRFHDEPKMVGLLNKKDFTQKHLDEESYVAMAGFVRDNIHDKIRLALWAKFQGRARPRFIPSKDLTPRPQDIVAYAYMFKHLEFGTPFEDLSDPIDFNGAKIVCFGVDSGKTAPEKMLRQVNILSYKDQDDFVIELKTKSKGDRIILAKIAPAATVRQTIAEVDQRISAGERERQKKAAELAGKYDQKIIARMLLNMQPGDILKIPKINFDLTRTYRELYGCPLIIKNPKIAKDVGIGSAVQNIRFQMDEKGIRLLSEAHISLTCSAEYTPHEHIMIFDKPFLLLMKRRDAAVPYFALWVDNPELLCKKKIE